MVDHNDIQMEAQLPKQLFFISGDYYITTFFLENRLRITAEHLTHRDNLLFHRVIDNDYFPDALRHTSLNSPFKLNQFLMNYHTPMKVCFVPDNLILTLEGGNPIKIQLDIYKNESCKSETQLQANHNVQPECEINLFKIAYFWDNSTQNANKYLVNGATLRKAQDGWQQITGLFALELNKVHNFVFRVARYGGNLSIGFGLITRQRKGAYYSGDLEHKGSVGIWSKKKFNSCCICNDGQKVRQWNSDMYFNEGSVVVMAVDLVKGQISWQIEGKSAQTQLLRFQKKELFVYCVMHDKGSEVELLSLK